MTSNAKSPSLPGKPVSKRLRVFAGPNGSGKSTIIDSIRSYTVGGRPLDFGIYINADDINRSLLNGTFSFQHFQLDAPTRNDFIRHALATGLINANFPEDDFRSSFSLNSKGDLKLIIKNRSEHLAQILATVIREYLLQAGCKMSFETVFSHPSKLDFMERAHKQGYKIYLYFVATEGPEINIARIKELRVKLGGHDVPEAKIRSRYQRSLNLMLDAAELAYQAFFFDNTSTDRKMQAEYFAHFKLGNGKKRWDPIDTAKVPKWFDRYYLNKI